MTIKEKRTLRKFQKKVLNEACNCDEVGLCLNTKELAQFWVKINNIAASRFKNVRSDKLPADIDKATILSKKEWSRLETEFNGLLN